LAIPRYLAPNADPSAWFRIFLFDVSAKPPHPETRSIIWN
jgi:hypothetical protein